MFSLGPALAVHLPVEQVVAVEEVVRIPPPSGRWGTDRTADADDLVQGVRTGPGIDVGPNRSSGVSQTLRHPRSVPGTGIASPSTPSHALPESAYARRCHRRLSDSPAIPMLIASGSHSAIRKIAESLPAWAPIPREESQLPDWAMGSLSTRSISAQNNLQTRPRGLLLGCIDCIDNKLNC